MKVTINDLTPMPTTRKQLVAQDSLGRFNFYSKNINWELIKVELRNTGWEHLLKEKDTEGILTTSTTAMIDICEKHVPKKFTNQRKRNIPRDRKILIRKLDNLRNRLRTTHHAPA